MNKSNQKGKNNWLTWKSHIKNSFRSDFAPLCRLRSFLLESKFHRWAAGVRALDIERKEYK